MIELASSERQVVVRAAGLDSNPFLLNVLNGTIDLRTGELHRHNRDDLITKLAPVKYDPEARSEVWDKFLATTTDNDQDLAEFLQRITGYTITGDISEEVLFFLHGPTGTGKSTFIEAIKTVLGAHAKTADFETFLKRRGDAGIRNDIARLDRTRMVSSIEVDDGKQLAEGLIKYITGGEPVTARFLFKESVRVPAPVQAVAGREPSPGCASRRRRDVETDPVRAVPEQGRESRHDAQAAHPRGP